MSQPKKFGTFEGVFTPSLLTILGVIMYMRLGWVVGHAGLIGAIAIILISHVISITTGLSLSSIATDKKIRVGGIYYMLSRSLGLPIGGALGIALFVGTAFSIALYLVGFAEIFNDALGWNTEINDLRLTGSITLASLAILALISTSLALKAQYLILAAIGLSLVAVFLSSWEFAPTSINLLPTDDSASMVTVFAVFFPAVTGFTVGVAMSGDLKNPKHSIPRGTLLAIGVGLLVYIALAVYMALVVDSATLRSDEKVMFDIALYTPLVIAGIWGATLSSALGGILGAPRILQAMSVDKVTPAFFGRGYGKNNEPRTALLLTVVIAELGILIGDLNAIAGIVSMFYLTAYGFINLSYILENWASSDFRPTFKIPSIFGIVGFLATFYLMFQLDPLAMLAAFVVIFGIFFYLTRKQLSVVSGDVWQSVWSSLVKRGLEQLNKKTLHQRNWRPNILLFSGEKGNRKFLVTFSKWLAGNLGLISNFELVETGDRQISITKMDQSRREEGSADRGIFGRVLDCRNVYEGVENVARIYGFSGVEPNTVLMGWARNSRNPEAFARLTRSLNHLDYNVLYLDYDKERGFGKMKLIDLWWRGAGNNAYLMLSLVRFMIYSHEWRNAKIRVRMVDNTGNDQARMLEEAKATCEYFRMQADIEIVDNVGQQRSFYQIVKRVSAEADLIMVGIPQVIEGKERNFVRSTNGLVDVIGTTLLVKASSYFEDITIGKVEG